MSLKTTREVSTTRHHDAKLKALIKFSVHLGNKLLRGLSTSPLLCREAWDSRTANEINSHSGSKCLVSMNRNSPLIVPNLCAQLSFISTERTFVPKTHVLTGPGYHYKLSLFFYRYLRRKARAIVLKILLIRYQSTRIAITILNVSFFLCTDLCSVHGLQHKQGFALHTSELCWTLFSFNRLGTGKAFDFDLLTSTSSFFTIVKKTRSLGGLVFPIKKVTIKKCCSIQSF